MPGGGCPDDDTDRWGGLRGILHWRRTAYGCEGNLVGTMNQDSFIENPGEQINSIQNTTLTLYFSNLDGDGLVKEVREDVYYSSNISMEKLIMEQLLDGPKTKDAKVCDSGGDQACLCVGGGRRLLRQPG